MAIDILFIIMAAFGFYFGFTFGLTKVVLVVGSLVFAIFTAMAMTPTATNLIVDTFEIDSVFLPFVAFLITLLVVLMLSRIVTKLIEETIDNKKFDSMSQGIGGVIMALVFTLLYSVLVVFFGQARVIDLVFNQDVMVTKADQNVRLGIQKIEVNNNIPISMKIFGDSMIYTFKGEGDLNFGSKQTGDETHESYIAGRNDQFRITSQDTIIFGSARQMHILVGQEMICFCDSFIMVTAQNDSIFFDCTDKEFSSQSITSFFYKYIEVIPKRGTMLMQGVVPFVESFIDYMTVALERLEKGNRKTPNPIEVYSEDDSKTTTQPEVIDPDEEVWIEEDSMNFSIDTTNMPSIKPNEKEEKDVKYEG